MTCSCITRRRALCMAAFTALATSSLLAGCGDKAAEQQSLAPVEIDRSTSCELDGMLLADYPGPKAQIHYAGQEKPSFFCDTIELFNTLLAGEQVRAVRAVYVQDMGKADWNEPKGHWIDAKAAFVNALPVFIAGTKEWADKFTHHRQLRAGGRCGQVRR